MIKRSQKKDHKRPWETNMKPNNLNLVMVKCLLIHESQSPERFVLIPENKERLK